MLRIMHLHCIFRGGLDGVYLKADAKRYVIVEYSTEKRFKAKNKNMVSDKKLH